MKGTEHQEISETERTRVVDQYLAAWNETDSANRRQLVNQTWAEDASYVDPMVRGEGRDGIDAMIAQVQRQFPGVRFRRVTKVDGHNSFLRFGGNWARTMEPRWPKG